MGGPPLPLFQSLYSTYNYPVGACIVGWVYNFLMHFSFHLLHNFPFLRKKIAACCSYVRRVYDEKNGKNSLRKLTFWVHQSTAGEEERRENFTSKRTFFCKCKRFFFFRTFYFLHYVCLEIISEVVRRKKENGRDNAQNYHSLPTRRAKKKNVVVLPPTSPLPKKVG